MRNIETLLGEKFNPQVKYQFSALMSIILDHLEGSAGDKFEDNVPQKFVINKLLVAYLNHKAIIDKNCLKKCAKIII
jgi:hypothetical protein